MFVSPSLYRLLNAAAIDAEFCSLFLAAPARAASLAEHDPQAAFGCPLPDASLTLAPIRLEEADWRFLRRMPPASSLPEVWGHLRQELAATHEFSGVSGETAAGVGPGDSRGDDVSRSARHARSTGGREARMPDVVGGAGQFGRMLPAAS